MKLIQNCPGTLSAIIVHTDQEENFLLQLSEMLKQAGFASVEVLPELPAILPQPCFLIMDEKVGGRDARTVLPQKLGADTSLCVLVSAPYIEKIKHWLYDETSGLQADMIVIKGTPEYSSHLDMSFTATSEPKVVALLFKRIAQSLREDAAGLPS